MYPQLMVVVEPMTEDKVKNEEEWASNLISSIVDDPATDGMW